MGTETNDGYRNQTFGQNIITRNSNVPSGFWYNEIATEFVEDM